MLGVLRDLGVLDEREPASADDGPWRKSGVGEGASSIPIIEAWNKWDLLDEERRIELEGLAASDDMVLPLSAASGVGVEALRERLGDMLTQGARVHEFTLGAGEGARIAWLHAHGEVLADEATGEGGARRHLRVRLTEREFGRYCALA